jgi:hypothetical protein
MKTGMITALICALAVLAGNSPARGDDFEKHLKKYYKHMEEAYEELREGDIDDYYEELGKAQREYDKAYRRSAPPFYGAPPYEPPIYNRYDYGYAPYPRYGPRWGGWINFGFRRGPYRCW